MATNKYFRNFTYTREQDVADDLIVEAIKIHGVDVKYLPRTIQNLDQLLGEDVLSIFDEAVEIEMYVKNTTGFEGEGDFLSKFDLQIRDQVTFTIARKRWDQMRTEKLYDEVGYVYQSEDANTGQYANTESFLLETATANGYSISSSRPLEGDLIFFPFTNKLYEIKFVEHEAIFYQHGKLYTYDLTCELFDRIGGKRIDTGNTVIDAIETRYTQDALQYQFTLEDDLGILMSEDGGSILQEYGLSVTVSTEDNAYIQQQSYNYIDFSEQNPFSEIDRY